MWWNFEPIHFRYHINIWLDFTHHNFSWRWTWDMLHKSLGVVSESGKWTTNTQGRKRYRSLLLEYKLLISWQYIKKYGNHILDLRRSCKHRQYYNCHIEFIFPRKSQFPGSNTSQKVTITLCHNFFLQPLSPLTFRLAPCPQKGWPFQLHWPHAPKILQTWLQV